MAGVMGGAARWGALLVGGLALAAAAAWGLSRAHEEIAAARLDPEGALTASGQLSPDGRFLAVLRTDGAAEILAAADGRRLGLVRGHGAELVSASFSADGRTLMTVDAAGRAILTRLDGEAFREAVHGEALARAAEQGAWSSGLRRPAAALWEFGWRDAPWSAARQIMNARALAPILPRGTAPPPGTMFRDCEFCPQMVVVPAGEVILAVAAPDDTLPTRIAEKRAQIARQETELGRYSPANGLFQAEQALEAARRELSVLEAEADDQSQQGRMIRSDAAYAIGRFEVTVEEFRRFAEQTGAAVRSNCSNIAVAEDAAEPSARTFSWAAPGFPQSNSDPVVCVSVAEAEAFARWLSRLTNETYRLPTDDEWSYAARAGTAGPYWFGDELDAGCTSMNVPDQAREASVPGAEAMVACNDGHAFTAPAGSYPANGFGIFDILGNAWEMTQGCASGAEGCSVRAVRGGAYRMTSISRLGSSQTGLMKASSRSSSIGFRLVREIRCGPAVMGGAACPAPAEPEPVGPAPAPVASAPVEPAPTASASAPTPTPEPNALETSPELAAASAQADDQAWSMAQLVHTVAAYTAYLQQTPNGAHAADARAALARLSSAATLARFTGRWGEMASPGGPPDCSATIRIQSQRNGEEDHLIIRTGDAASGVDYTVTAIRGSTIAVRANDGTNATGEFSIDPKGRLSVMVGGRTVVRGGRCAS